MTILMLVVLVMILPGCKSRGLRIAELTGVAAAAPTADAPSTPVDPHGELEASDADGGDRGVVESLLYVYVSGAAAQPGVYRLPTGSRACDALAMAGGASKEALLDLVNLATPVFDGQQLHIPSRSDAAVVPTPTQAAGGSGLAGGRGAGPVNINRATATELTALPGIGPVLAGRIVTFRAQHGPFSKVDGLLGVQGIGQSKLADIRPLVTVGP